MEGLIMRISTSEFNYCSEGLYRQIYRQSDTSLFIKVSDNYLSLFECIVKDDYLKDKEQQQIYNLFNNNSSNDYYHWKDEYTFIEKIIIDSSNYNLFIKEHDKFIKICLFCSDDIHVPIIQYWIDKKDNIPSCQEAIDWIKKNINKKQLELTIKYYSLEPTKNDLFILYPDISEEWCSSAIGIKDGTVVGYDDGWYRKGELSKGNFLMNLEQVELLFYLFSTSSNIYNYLETYNHNGIDYYIYGKEFVNKDNLPSSNLIYFTASGELFLAMANTTLQKAVEAIKTIYIDKVKKFRYVLLNHWCEQLAIEKSLNNNNTISTIFSNESLFPDLKIVVTNQDNGFYVGVYDGYSKEFPMFVKNYVLEALTNKTLYKYAPIKTHEKNGKKYTIFHFETAEKQKVLCWSNNNNDIPILKEYSFMHISKEEAFDFVEKTL